MINKDENTNISKVKVGSCFNVFYNQIIFYVIHSIGILHLRSMSSKFPILMLLIKNTVSITQEIIFFLSKYKKQQNTIFDYKKGMKFQTNVILRYLGSII